MLRNFGLSIDDPEADKKVMKIMNKLKQKEQ